MSVVQAIPAALKKTLMILEPVTKACPGLKECDANVTYC